MNHAVVTAINRISNVTDVITPLLSPAPAAGFPDPGDDLLEESLNVQQLLVKHPHSTFFVRVEGDSMEGAGIFSGDILVVDRSVSPTHGRIVVAVVGGGLVVKRVAITREDTYLLSANDQYVPLVISKDEGCYIWGVVTGSVRQF